MRLDFIRLSENRADRELFLRIMDEQGVTLTTPIGFKCGRCGARFGGERKPRSQIYCSKRCRVSEVNRRRWAKKKAARSVTNGDRQ
jgi:endogenous inhibitor of DNA gyrase (YacG/DUF329 family)